MKYRKMILIIIIISLGQILLSYIANTSRTHARTHARTHGRTHTHSRPPTTVAVQVVAVRWVCAPNHEEVNAPFSLVPLAMNGRSVFHLYYNVCLSMLANCRSQFLLDRLGRCLNLLVSTDSIYPVTSSRLSSA